MTLGNGRHYLAIPGPSVMPDRVLQAMHRAAPNIYEGSLIDMMPGLIGDLKAVARTKAHVAIYIANGHGAWEAALANTHQRGDRVLVLANGRFAYGWSEMAAALGVDCEILDFGKTASVDLDRVVEALNGDKEHCFTSVLMTHVDTSSSVKNDVLAVRQAMDSTGHPALLMVDCIASLACDRFEMDAWGVDLIVAACQKGLMTPPAMAFVYFNEKAEELGKSVPVSSYWDWGPRVYPADFYQYFCGTAPTHHLFGLREALNMINEEGLEQVWTRHEKLASAVWAACEAWGAEDVIALNVPVAAQRSCAVTTVNAGGPVGTDLRRWVEANGGLTLGIGLGMSMDHRSSDQYFRIGHMGHVNSHMVLGALGVIEAGLKALNVPYGTGALSAAAQICCDV